MPPVPCETLRDGRVPADQTGLAEDALRAFGRGASGCTPLPTCWTHTHTHTLTHSHTHTLTLTHSHTHTRTHAHTHTLPGPQTVLLAALAEALQKYSSFQAPPTLTKAPTGKSSPQEVRNRANSAHVRQSRPDSGLGFQVKVLKTF